MSIKSYYVKETSFDGMPTREYTADFGDFRVNSNFFNFFFHQMLHTYFIFYLN